MAKTGNISLKTAHIKLKVDNYFLSQASLVFNSEKCGRHPWPDVGGGAGVTSSDATLGPPSSARAAPPLALVSYRFRAASCKSKLGRRSLMNHG